jgi:hypothetical protein
MNMNLLSPAGPGRELHYRGIPSWRRHNIRFLINKKFLRGPGAVFIKRAPDKKD